MKYLISISFLLFASYFVEAQNISVEVSANEVGVGEAFLVTYNVDGNAQNFSVPEVKDFKIYESGKSTSVSIINGKMSRSTGYNLTFVPTKIGTFDIPPATAIIKGNEVKSSGFTIKVLANSNSGATNRSSNQSNQNNTNQRPDAPNNWKDNIILLAQADKNQMYVGEQITITYKLLRRVDYQSMEIDKLPVFNGFLSEEMEIPTDKTEGTMEYKGKKYYYQAFRKVALFATQSGVQTVDPLSAKGIILVEEKDPFFDGFWGSSFFTTTTPKQISISSNRLDIKVLSLPEENKPANFSGAVGQFNVSRNVNSTQILQGESSTLEIIVTGHGNIKNIVAPKIQTGSLLDIYDPEIKDDFKKRGDVYGGSRNFTYAIVPKISGKTTIPEYDFVYFDPKQKKYISEKLPEINLTILPKNIDEENNNANPEFDTEVKGQLAENYSKSLLPFAIGACSALLLLSLILIARKKRKDKDKQKIKDMPWPDLNQLIGKEKYAALGQFSRENAKQILNSNALADNELLSQIKDDDIREKLAFIIHSCDRAAYSPMEVIAIEELEKLAKDIFSRLKKDTGNV